jgi:TldD protein
MQKYFDKYKEEIGLLKQLLKDKDYRYIARFMHSEFFHCIVTNEETLSKKQAEVEGLGLQVFTKNGGVGFSTTDIITKDKIENAVKLAIELAEKSEKSYKEDLTFFDKVKPYNEDVYPNVKYDINYLTPAEREEKLKILQNDLNQMIKDFHFTSTLAIGYSEWRIIRDDGTDTSYMIPRSVVSTSIVFKKNGKTVSTRTHFNDKGYDIFYDEKKMKYFKERIKQKETQCREVIDAPAVESGSYKLLIDYPLAKGLAHEAFGHASESDGAKKSILFNDKGKFQIGMKVASDNVSIIEESIEGDYAYQPISANGIPREKVTLVDHGVLNAGLGDMFSALSGGIKISGACRVQSYDNIPLPRMSNIRIEVENPETIDKRFEDISPQDLYNILDKRGELEEEPVIYMTGYKGGQVNPKYGDFVFNCSIMYKFQKDKPIQVFRPGIFSGKVLEALKSIKFGIGGLILDAIGTCGKEGQRVPSSGGSNMFIFIEKSNFIKIGGGK